MERVRYLQDLREISRREGCDVHAYVLMTNHVHLLMTPAASGQIALVMQSLGRRYVRYFNDRYRRTGTLWEGRYESPLVDREIYLLHCYRYPTEPVPRPDDRRSAGLPLVKPRTQCIRPPQPADPYPPCLSGAGQHRR